jgi:probable rRNA maturation factor
VDVSFTVRSEQISPTRVRDLVRATLEEEKVRDALISVAFVGERAIVDLNRRFLSHEAATDVLSFGLSRSGKGSSVVGDIYICPRVAERSAQALGIPLTTELSRLVVHGTLHVLGYDHPEGPGRTSSAMWKRQEKILARHG